MTVVLHTGMRPWRIPLELRELFPPPPEGAERLLPALSHLLIDRGRLAAEALDQPDNLAAAFFRIEEARSPEDLMSLAAPLSRMLPKKTEPELRRSFTDLLVKTFHTAFPGVRISHVHDLEELHMLEENMIRWRNSVLRKGVRQGRRDGHKEGLREGFEEGKKQGEQEGQARGQIAGMQRLLLKLMKLRFGALSPAVRREVREISSLGKLEELAGRVLTAGSLSDLGLGQGYESTPCR